jgi:hypothetical protein
MSYNIFAAMFAEELEPGQRIKPAHDASPVTVVAVTPAGGGFVVISHDRGSCVRGGRDLVRLEVSR